MGHALHLEFAPAWSALGESYFVFGNWNLLWYGGACRGTARVAATGDAGARPADGGCRDRGDPVCSRSFAFPEAAVRLADQTTFNRATLHFAPVAVVFVALAFQAFAVRWRAAAADARAQLTLAMPPTSDARASRRHAVLHRHAEPRARAARAGEVARGHPFRADDAADRKRCPPASRHPTESTSSRSPTSRRATRTPQFVLKSLRSARRDGARAARAMGRLRRQPGGVGSGVPRLRLHRREVVLVRRRDARRQRRLLAALAQAARRAAGSADRRWSTSRTRRSAAAFARCSSASTASASPTRRSPTGFRSRRRIRSACRSGSTDSSISAGRFRRPRSPHWSPAFLRRDRALDAVRAAGAELQRARTLDRRRADRAAHARRDAGPRRGRGAARARPKRISRARRSSVATSRARAAAARKYKQCHGAIGADGSAAAARNSPLPIRTRRVAAALAAHQRGDHASGRARVPGRARRRRPIIRPRCTISA